MERRTIDELVARYELEPTLADVLVEGPGDKAFVEWLAQELGLTDVMAYEIGTVDVPAFDLAKSGLENNNRGRVRYVARELELRANRDLYHTVAGIIDGDLDHFEGAAPSERLIIVTDFTSVELYLFTGRAVSKLIRLVLGSAAVDADAILDEIAPLLKEIFVVRTAARRLNIPLPMIDFSRVCVVRGKSFAFDREQYASRFIRRNGFTARHDEFLSEVNALHRRPVADRRIVIHGHDFVSVLRWYCRDVLRLRNVPGNDEFVRALRGCLEIGDLNDMSLVAELRDRFGK